MSRKIRLPVAILAGGLATRLRPLTSSLPKVLIEVAQKPFLEHQLAGLREQGVGEIVLCVGFLGESIQERFGDGRSYGVRIRYSFDGPKLLGTGGAIRNALPLLGDEFFVMYGDSYLKIDFATVEDAFAQSGKAALMTVFHNRGLWDVSNVSFSNGEIRRYDKTSLGADMEYIDYGLSVFKSSAFVGYPADEPLDLAHVMRRLVESGEMAGYEAQERFYEIGSHDGLRELSQLLESAQSK